MMNATTMKMTLMVCSLTAVPVFIVLSVVLLTFPIFADETNWRNDYPDEEDGNESCDSSLSEDIDHSCFSYRHKYHYGKPIIKL